MLVVKPLGRLTLGRSGIPWEDIITQDLVEVRCEDERLIDVIQDGIQWRVLILAVLNLQVLLPKC
jgi:hypothetical protein